MRLLFVGDIVGKPGRSAFLDLIPGLRERRGIDAVVANCENAAGGRGITPEIADSLLTGGADVLTSGNHVWAYRQIIDYLEHESRLVRPANYPKAPGSGSFQLRLASGATLGVIQVEGRVFMRDLECPFATIENELAKLGDCTATFVDMHCEATSEKQALGWHFAGRVSALIGTHTHVQTADERVLPGGTAYLTDAGMTGPHDSVIGMRCSAAIERFLTQRQNGHHVATENVLLCGVVVEIDDSNGKALSIERVREPWHGDGTAD